MSGSEASNVVKIDQNDKLQVGSKSGQSWKITKKIIPEAQSCECGSLALCFYQKIADFFPVNQMNEFAKECSEDSSVSSEARTVRQNIYACFANFDFKTAISEGKDCQACMLSKNGVCTVSEAIAEYDFAAVAATEGKPNFKKDAKKLAVMGDSFKCLGDKMEKFFEETASDPEFEKKLKDMEAIVGKIPETCKQEIGCEKAMPVPVMQEDMDCDQLVIAMECFAPHYVCILSSIGIDPTGIAQHMAQFKKEMNCDSGLAQNGKGKEEGREGAPDGAVTRRRRNLVVKYGYNPLGIMMSMAS